MIIVPLTAYFSTKAYLEKVYYLEEYYSSPHEKENIIMTWSAGAGVVGIWVVIVIVVVLKNGSDFLDVFC